MVDYVREAAHWKEVCDDSWAEFQRSLSKRTAPTGLNHLITIDGRSYHVTSDSSGRLALKLVSEIEVGRILPTIEGRILLESDAVDHAALGGNVISDTTWFEKRQVRFEGDVSMLLEGDFGQEIVNLRHKDPELHEQYEQIRHELEAAEREQELADSRHALDHFDISRWVDPSESRQPILSNMWGWLLFSAGSTMMGNMGQSNYSASNQVLDALTMTMRQISHPNAMPMTLMWGAVGNLGMRWKAFASADQLLKADNVDEVMLQPVEASVILRHLFSGVAPEWLLGSKFDAATAAYITSAPFRIPDPWGQGRGGGTIDFHDTTFAKEEKDDRHGESDSGDSDTSSVPPLEECASQVQANIASDRSSSGLDGQQRPKHATRSAWLHEGRRVQIHRLERNSNMNGAKATLIEEVDGSKWRVRIDGINGDKLVRLENLMTLTGKPLSDFRGVHDGDGSRDVPVPLEQYCIAGTWDDWIPRDMQWDSNQQCFTFEVVAQQNVQTKFAICRGQAGEKKWKTKGQNSWNIEKADVPTRYQIRLFLNLGGSVRKVDWRPISLAIDS